LGRSEESVEGHSVDVVQLGQPLVRPAAARARVGEPLGDLESEEDEWFARGGGC